MSMCQQQVMFYGGNKFLSKMIKLFDYIFYRIAFLFRQISVVGDLNSLTIISIVETLNIVTITNVMFNTLTEENANINIYLLFLIALFLVILNSIRYLRFKKYRDLDNLWKEEEKGNKFKRGIFILVYIVLSILLYVLC